jgi:hypothetical protein
MSAPQQLSVKTHSLQRDTLINAHKSSRVGSCIEGKRYH